MLNQALQFILDVAFGVVVYAALVRFLLQLCRAPVRNPVGEFVGAITDFAVRPLRRIVPGLYGWDLASLLLAWGGETVLVMLTVLLRQAPISLPHLLPLALYLGLVHLLKYAIVIFIFASIVQAVMSWVNPYGSPIGPVLEALTRPVLRPLRRYVKPVGNVDLTPLIAIVLAQLLLMLPVAWLESIAR